MQETSQRRRLPRTRYVTASPETWSLIRGAYLSGMSAPSVAARFGVSETALRRRAGREGWTKAAFAAGATPWALRRMAAQTGAGGVAPGSAPDSGETAGEAPVLDHWRAPLRIHHDDLARKALAGAMSALKAGEALNALRLARAAAEIARLDGVLNWPEEDLARSEEESEGRFQMMQTFIRERALRLAEDLAAGRDLPPEYQIVKADRDHRAALDDLDNDVSGVSG